MKISINLPVPEIYYKLHSVIKYSLIFFSIFLISSCNEKTTEPSGLIVTQKRSCTSFSEIIVNLPAEIWLIRDDKCEIHVETDDNLLDRVKFKNRNNKLFIFSNREISAFTNLNIYLHLKDLSEIIINGRGNVYSEDTFQSGKCKIMLSDYAKAVLNVKSEEINILMRGQSELELAGSTRLLLFKSGGSCKLNAFHLISEDSRIKISNEAEAFICSKKTITGKIKGRAKVIYKGNPEIKVTKKSQTVIVREN